MPRDSVLRTRLSGLDAGQRVALLIVVLATAATLGVLGVFHTGAVAAPAAGPRGGGEAPPVSGAVGVGLELLLLQDAWEERLTAKVGRALGEAFGGDVRVTLNVELDPRTVVRTGVDVPPAGLVPSSFLRRSGGEAGPMSDDPNSAPAVDATPRAATFTERREIAPELYGRREERQLAPSIRRLTASVVIAERRLAKCADRYAREQEIGRILDVVKHAVGYDVDRGDRIEPAVADLPRASAAPVAPESAAAFDPVVAVRVALVLLLAALCYRLLRRPAQSPAAQPGKPAAAPRAKAGEARRDAEKLRVQVEQAIAQDPDAMSRLVDEWLMEGKA